VGKKKRLGKRIIKSSRFPPAHEGMGGEDAKNQKKSKGGGKKVNFSETISFKIWKRQLRATRRKEKKA